MDNQIIHNMVEYMTQQAEFPFDCMDVEESVDDVLSFFGFHLEMSPAEQQQVKGDLLNQALSVELREVSRLVEGEASMILAGLRPYRRGCFREPSVSAGEYVQKVRHK